MEGILEVILQLSLKIAQQQSLIAQLQAQVEQLKNPPKEEDNGNNPHSDPL